MYNSKLYTILQHFDKYEQNRCRKYIQSPYFNRSEELVTLFGLFVKDINKPKSKGLERERLWKKIQPSKKYDDVRFRKYCSDLLKLVESFLAYENYSKDEIRQTIDLMTSLSKKKIPELYRTAIRVANRQLEKQNYRAAGYYYDKYMVENNLYLLTEYETKRYEKSNIEDISLNLDIFYLAEKLRFLCAAIAQKPLIDHKYQFHFTEQIIQHLGSFDYEYYPPVALYYQIFLTLTERENEDHFYKLKMLLDKYGLLFPPEEAKDVLYNAAINYCVGKINKGNHKFMKELFTIYEDLINKEIIFAEGQLTPWHFKNIVVIALRLGKYEWTENFIHTYSRKLPEAFRNNAVTFNLAQIYFHQKQHDKVIEQLRNVEYEDVAYNLGSKTMLISTYYEMDEIEPLYSLLESFRVYLNRHKHDISQNRRQNHANFIKFTKRLLKIMPGDKKPIEKLKKEIGETKNITGANWLKEKIAELEG